MIDDHTSLPERDLGPSLTRRFVLALVLVGLVVSANWLVLQHLLERHEHVAQTIDVAARQRTLSQRVAYFAYAYAHSPAGLEREGLRATLLQTVKEMETSHTAMIAGTGASGSDQPLSPHLTRLFREEFAGYDRLIRGYLGVARAVAEAAPSTVSPADPRIRYLSDEGAYVLLPAMDRVVTEYRRDAERDFATLQIALTAGTAISLVLLAVMGFTIFRPLVRRVQNSFAGYRAKAAELAESEARFRDFAESASDLLWEMDANLRFTYLSGFNRRFGSFSNKLIGLTRWESLGVDPDRDPAWAEHRATLEAGEPFKDFRYWRECEDGESRCFSVSGYPLLNADGRFRGYRGTSRDLTREIRQQEKLEAARRQAEVANHAKSEFLATMSHELRTPMNGLLGMANLLLKDRLSEEQRDKVQTLKSSAEALLVVLNDVLDLSRIEAGHSELERVDFSLFELLGSLQALWGGRAEAKGLRFDIQRESDLPHCLKGDARRFRQILSNLVSNAVKFTDRGFVRLEVSDARVDEQLVFLKIAVVDSGPGIPGHRIEEIFDSFSQVDGSSSRRHGGTGLGLAISRQLSELMGGSLTAENLAEGGCRFLLTLPFTQGDPEAVQKPMAHHGRPDEAGEMRLMGPLRVLVAEDNAVNQAVIRGHLERLGYVLTLVEDGEQAVEELRKGDFDLVFMDIQMPGMDGLQATRAIRALPGHASWPPIIALTANAMRGDREICLKAGMNDYIAKPIDPVWLFAAIARQTGVDLPETQPSKGRHEARAYFKDRFAS